MQRNAFLVELSKMSSDTSFYIIFLSCKPKFSKNIASQRKGETVSERRFISLHRVDNIKEQGVCKGCENQRF